MRFSLRVCLLGLLALCAFATADDAAADDAARPDDKRRTLIILLDGFRWNFIKLLGEDPSGFKEFLKEGAHAESVRSVFPTLSFPAWTTISTGVYPETHGILANFFYSRQRQMVFKLNDTTSTRKASWWQTPEPLWTTATRNGLRVATILWSRSDVPVYGIRPEVSQGYELIEDALGNFRDSLQRSMDYLHKGFDLVMTYSELVDDVGHRYGPDSLEMKYTVGDVSKLLLGMFRELEVKKLKDKVNVILIGDHGMATVDPGEPIRLRQHLDPADVEQALGQGAFVSIYAKPGRVEFIYSKLANVPGLIVWRRGEVPQELHYNRNPVLPDIIVSAKKGYLIRGLHSKDEPARKPQGIHGYQPDIEDMRTVFYAVGPDFSRGVKVDALELVDEYQMFCHILRIPAQAHNGSWERVRGLLAGNPERPYGEEDTDDNDDVHHVGHVQEPTAIRSTPAPVQNREPPQAPPQAPPPQTPTPAPAPANFAAAPLRVAVSLAVGLVGWYIFLCVVTNSH